MNRSNIKQVNIITFALCCIIAVITLFSSPGISTAIAEDPDAPTYSNVMDDLCKDSSFNASAYAFDETMNPNSFSIISIGEGSNGELFVYVYAGSGTEYKLNGIRVSQSIGDNYAPHDYDMNFINSGGENGIFHKYIVSGIILKKSPLRYYEIPCIFRPFIAGTDTVSGDNTVSRVPITVGVRYEACTVNGKVSVSAYESETITITQKYVGRVVYKDGQSYAFSDGICTGCTDAYFVAFDTDKPIDRLMEATVGWKSQDVSAKCCCNAAHVGQHELKSFYDYSYGEILSNEKTLTPDDVGQSNVSGISNGNVYSWNRIQSTEEFLAYHAENATSYELINCAVDEFKKTKWVLSFAEYERSSSIGDDLWKFFFGFIGSVFVEDAEVKETKVSDVTILRLKFETAGTVYNLGVVDNYQTGSNKPVNRFLDTMSDIPSWVWWLVGGIAILIVLMVLAFVVPGFSKVLFMIFSGIGKGILFVLSAPFRLVGLIVDAISNKKDDG